MKIIRSRKAIIKHVFETASILTLLISLLAGIVFAPKPDKPGKPPFEPPPVQYYIFSVDLEGQLNLDNPENLVVVTYADDSGWYLAPIKGTKAVDWQAYLNEFWPQSEEEECGLYTTENLGNVPTSIDAQELEILYYWTSRPFKGLGYDGESANFWQIHITWGWHEDDWDPSDVHSLRVWTDYGAEAEGIYYPDDDMWIIDFSGASWELWASDADGYGHLSDWGTISELTVTIINNGPVDS